MKFIALSLAAATSLAALAPSLAHAQTPNDFARAERRAERDARRAGAQVVVTPPVVQVAPPVAPRVVVTRPTFSVGFAAPRTHVIVRPAAPAPVYVAPPVANTDFREAQQERRIRIAAMQGQLDAREYQRLMNGQARIDVMQARAAADGMITRREARQISMAQSAEDQRIMRLQGNFRVNRGF